MTSLHPDSIHSCSSCVPDHSPCPPAPQDAHEFLHYLLNQACEVLEAEAKKQAQAATGGSAGSAPSAASPGSASSSCPAQQPSQPGTWVHDIFQGRLVNETRCLHCETVTSREEVFMDLSLEISQNSSLTSCLRNFR